MKKILAIALSLVMVLAMVACGEEPAPTPDPGTDTPPVITNPDEIADEMTSEDGKYEIGFVTDVGQLKDKSFNQGTYDGVKLYAAANGLSYKYYQPANGDKATDDDRYDAMKAACDNGAKAVVCAGFMQGPALEKVAAEYPDVSFIFIDGWSTGANVAGIAFAEEQSGYLAGYAVVKEGYEKLGFTGGGGGTNPPCVRFGYGFVQGANDAAKELGKTVDINYTWQFGNTFSPSPELMAMVSGWYNAGTEIVFCCGGNMFQSVAQAAAENDGAVVGVDTDQSFESETVVTSATKGLSSAVQWALAKVYDGTFSEIGGNSTSLGADNNAVGLPTATWSMQNFTVEEYEALFQKLLNGEVTIDNNSEMSNPAEAGLTNITVNFVA
ncbi:MAG: BMP family ABC transporter substrate-binding protein [Angelakisella sp.]|nr:BMP family ABC transporter substrate-binding protein [Angelakisella sp.]